MIKNDCNECAQWFWRCSFREIKLADRDSCPCCNCLVKSMCNDICEEFINCWRIVRVQTKELPT